MRDMLVPIFGEWGAVVAQFLLTVVIVLGLIGAVWWFMRRYSGVHFGGIGRGRVPRLAVIDVIPVDRRRRLVLVRRDNVEHLLLIGGPSDVVVEGAIQRVRSRSAQAAAQTPAARAAVPPAIESQPAAEPETPQEPELAAERPPTQPIPFPVGRNGQAQPASARPLPRPMRQPPPPQPEAARAEPAAAPAASAVAPHRPNPLQQLLRGRPAAPPPPPQPERRMPQELGTDALLPEVMTAEPEPLPAPSAPSLPATFAEAELATAEAARQSTLDLGEADQAVAGEDFSAEAPFAEEPAPATAPGQDATLPADAGVRVSDLEREMARLLDEITTRRSS